MKTTDTTFITLLVVANDSVAHSVTSQPHMMILSYGSPLLGYRFNEIIVTASPYSESEVVENANLQWLKHARLKLCPNGRMIYLF